MTDSTTNELLREIAANQKAQILVQNAVLKQSKRQLEIAEIQFKRSEKLHDRAEAIQDRSEAMMATTRKLVRILIPIIIAVLIALLVITFF